MAERHSSLWRCVSRLEYGKQYCHQSPTMDEYKLHDAITEAINRILEDKDEILATVTEAIRAAFSKENGSGDMLALRQRRADLKLSIESLMNGVVNSMISSDELDNQFREAMAECDRLDEAIKQQERERAAEECENTRLTEIIRTIQETPCALNEYDDTLVRKIIDTVTVDSKNQITVSFGYGVDIPIAIS